MQPTVSGDSLDFDPVGFNANATGAAGIDVTDGNLNFTIMAHAGYAIDMVSLSEAGDTTLAGFGTDVTFTSVTGMGVLNILAVDGVGIARDCGTDQFDVHAVGRHLWPGHRRRRRPALLRRGWSGSWLKNVEQVLIDNNVAYNLGATKVSINLDNTLDRAVGSGNLCSDRQEGFWRREHYGEHSGAGNLDPDFGLWFGGSGWWPSPRNNLTCPFWAFCLS